MKIGIPKECKIREGRVGLIPDAAAQVVKAGHDVWIEKGAGEKSGYSDSAYEKVGVRLADGAAQLYEQAQLVVKVKEPIDHDLQYLKSHHLLFCYLHLAAEPSLQQRLLEIGLTAVAFETVEDPDGRLPLLAPMSDIAGQLSIHSGLSLLHHYQGGRGVLLGGLAATERGEVVVLGAGEAGGAAARVAANLGCRVHVFARRRSQQQQMMALGQNVSSGYPFEEAIASAVARADLVVGAVLVTGARAPVLVTEAMVQKMQPGSVIVDISVDQGGCIETTRATNYEQPSYILHDVVHFGVTNMPGAVPRTASQALSASLLPYVLELARPGWENNHLLSKGINVSQGKIIHPALKN